MEFQDKVLKCIDCGEDFVFTAGEQLFFHDKQFKNEPKRCKTCKTQARSRPRGASCAGAESTVIQRLRHRLRARVAESRPPFLSVRRRADPCSAANASSPGEPRPLPDLLAYSPICGKSLMRSVRYHRVCPHFL